jgi:hypothetical protein
MADAFFSTSWRILEPHGCATVIGSVQLVDDWVIEYVVKRLARKDVVRCRSCRRRIGPPQADNLVDLQLGIPSRLGATFRRNFSRPHLCSRTSARPTTVTFETSCAKSVAEQAHSRGSSITVHHVRGDSCCIPAAGQRRPARRYQPAHPIRSSPYVIVVCALDEAILTARAHSYRGAHRDVVRAMAFELQEVSPAAFRTVGEPDFTLSGEDREPSPISPR